MLHILIYHHCWELMKSVGSHGSSSLLFMMKKVQGHISSKRHIYDIVFNEEFISKPLTKVVVRKQMDKCLKSRSYPFMYWPVYIVAKRALILACTVNFTAYCFMLWMCTGAKSNRVCISSSSHDGN